MAIEIVPTTAALYAPVGTGSEIVLLGQRCACGHVAFPRQRYGCERCGRVDGQTAVDLDPGGTVLAVATAHVQLNTAPKVPFTVGAVRLIDGAVVRGFLYPHASPGDRVEARDGREFAESVSSDRLMFIAAATHPERDARG